MRQQFCYWMLTLSVFLWIHSHFFYSNYVWRASDPDVGFGSANGSISAFADNELPDDFPFSWYYLNLIEADTETEDWLGCYPTAWGFAFGYSLYGTRICLPCWLLILFWIYFSRISLPSHSNLSLSNWIIAISFVITGMVLSWIGFMVPMIASLTIATLATFLFCIIQRIRLNLRSDAPRHWGSTNVRLLLFSLALFLWIYSHLYQGAAQFDNSHYYAQVGRLYGSTSCQLYSPLESTDHNGFFISETYQWIGCSDDFIGIDPGHFGFATCFNGYCHILCVPYFFLALLWFPWHAMLHSHGPFRFRIFHVLGLTTFVAIVAMSVAEELSLLLDVALLFATFSLIGLWIGQEARRIAITLWYGPSIGINSQPSNLQSAEHVPG